MDGDVGVGTRDAFAYFDDIQVHSFQPPPPAPTTTLPYSEDFADGVADYFGALAGDWSVQSERYRVEPGSNQDGVSILAIAEPLPTDLEVLVTINADDATNGRLSNAVVIFDYQDPTDFKFAGAYVGGDGWLIGHRTNSSWRQDARFDEPIEAWTDYDLQILIEGSTVTLTVDDVPKVSHTFTGGSLVDGGIGLGTKNALAAFDDVQVISLATGSNSVQALGQVEPLNQPDSEEEFWQKPNFSPFAHDLNWMNPGIRDLLPFEIDDLKARTDDFPDGEADRDDWKQRFDEALAEIEPNWL